MASGVLEQQMDAVETQVHVSSPGFAIVPKDQFYKYACP